MFVGRDRELDFLERAYRSSESALIPVYGRRRIGKTELLRKFLSTRSGIFHVGKLAPAAILIAELLRQVAHILDDPVLAELPADSWRRPLELLARYPSNKKLVIVFDELQWTAASSPELLSLLQELWDHQWRDAGNMFIILCGSYVGFMEREVLGRKAPLFGRRTGQILLRPFSYMEAAGFHPRWSRQHCAEAHFICGGVAAYLKAFDDRRSVEANIRDIVLDEMGVLRREPEFLLREELREVERYHAILFAIAGGAYSIKEIARLSGVSAQAGIHYYLQQLIELGYIERKHALTGRPPNRRSVHYVIGDALLRFWFRFVFPNESYLQRHGGDATFSNRIRPELSSFYGICFERMCRQALGRLYARERVDASWEVGAYWSKSVQIDVVGVRSDNWTDLGECKWGAVRSAKTLASELTAKASRFPNERGATVGLHAFVRKHPRHPVEALRWHDLNDLYEWE